MDDHQCEAMPEDCAVWAPRYQAERGKGWRLFLAGKIIPIRFCPFCGVELGEGEDDHA